MCHFSTSTTIIDTSLTHPHSPWYIMSCLHPYSQEARPDSVRAWWSTRAAILVPKWRSTQAHIQCHQHCHSTKHDTHTRSFLPNFKPETGEGLQWYKAKPVKGNLSCVCNIILRRNCWHVVIIFDKRPKYLCTSIPTRNGAENLSSLFIYLRKVLAFIWHIPLKYGSLLYLMHTQVW